MTESEVIININVDKKSELMTIMSLFKRKNPTSEEGKPPSKIDWNPLTDLRQLEELVDLSNKTLVVIFKHSTRCGISMMVLRQFENEFHYGDEVMLYYLDLLQHREISNAVADRFGVEHESPQIIVIKNGEATYNASHESIAAADLKDFL